MGTGATSAHATRRRTAVRDLRGASSTGDRRRKSGGGGRAAARARPAARGLAAPRADLVCALPRHERSAGPVRGLFVAASTRTRRRAGTGNRNAHRAHPQRRDCAATRDRARASVCRPPHPVRRRINRSLLRQRDGSGSRPPRRLPLRSRAFSPLASSATALQHRNRPRRRQVHPHHCRPTHGARLPRSRAPARKASSRSRCCRSRRSAIPRRRPSLSPT